MSKAKWFPVIFIIPITIAAIIIILYIMSVVFMWGNPFLVDEKKSTVKMNKPVDVQSFTGGEIDPDDYILNDSYKVKSHTFYINYEDDYRDRNNWNFFSAEIKYDIGDVIIYNPFSDSARLKAEDSLIKDNGFDNELINNTKVSYFSSLYDGKKYEYTANFIYDGNRYYIYSDSKTILKETVDRIIDIK